MTLRANITTTYRDANANPPRVTKNSRKEEADQGVHESESIRSSITPATKAPGHVKNRPEVRQSSQAPAAVDAFERSSPKEKSPSTQSAEPDQPALDSQSNTNESKVTSKLASAGYGPGSRAHVVKRTDAKSGAPDSETGYLPPQSSKAAEATARADASSKTSDVRAKTEEQGYGPADEESRSNSAVPIADETAAPAAVERSVATTVPSRSEHPKRMVPKGPPLELTKTDESREPSKTGKAEASKIKNQLLPVATPPKIRLAESSAKPARGSAEASPPTTDGRPASVSPEKPDRRQDDVAFEMPPASTDEAIMQRRLTAALQYGQEPRSNSQTSSTTGGDMVRHLQSEGVFGISANGRNLGTVDFIRQKQFEYKMDQKPFTADDLLLEAEKAIYDTLNSDQSSAVSKSLLQAAESVNAYRNHSLKSSEPTEMTAKRSRVAASAGKEDA